MTTTISNTVTTGIILNGVNYGSQLTITTRGDVAPSIYGAAGVLGLLPIDSVVNAGTISGGENGAGVYMTEGELTNDGLIVGGAGAYNSVDGGGHGGAGVVLKNDAAMTNQGTILGGPVGEGAYGGIGLAMAGSGATNSGLIAGAIGGSYLGLYDVGATGGAGVSMNGSEFVNDGTVLGGAGGEALLDSPPGPGGAGVISDGSDVTNEGTILGGAGGSAFGHGGTGGAGVALSGSTLTNEGTIIGGAGGVGEAFGGAGGVGVDQANSTITNDGLIIGGAGGSYGGIGGAGVTLHGGSLINSETIEGGAGGNAINLFGGYNYNGGAGGAGIYLNGGTVLNAGTIAGGAGGIGTVRDGAAGDAVKFGTAAGTLIIDPGAVFIGNVVADAGAADVLVLAAGSSAGTLSGLGSQFSGFSTLIEDAGANWIFDGANTLQGTVLFAGDAANDGTISGDGALTVTGQLINDLAISLGSGLTLTGLLSNKGTISGGTGRYGASAGGNGMVAVYVNAGLLLNGGIVDGGDGGDSGSGTNNTDPGRGGAGGTGVDLTGGTLTNQQIVEGGAGGAAFYSGAGGAGIAISGGTLTNQRTIDGGDGGAGQYGGAGGAGVVMTGGSLTNSQTISGGFGGNSIGFANTGTGGAGVVLTAGTVTNNMSIKGGAGGDAGLNGATGGAGVAMSGGVLANTKTIDGGVGGDGSFNFGEGGTGGAGVYLNGGTLINAGTIAGGAGGGGVFVGAAGDAVQFGAAAGTLVIDLGAAFIGAVAANSGAADVLVLGSTGGLGGTLSGLGSQFTGFSDLDFTTNARWLVEGGAAGFASLNSINDFAQGDTIVLDGFAVDPADTTYVSGVGLELTNMQGGRVTLDLPGIVVSPGVTAAPVLSIVLDGANTDITANLNGFSAGEPGFLEFSAADAPTNPINNFSPGDTIDVAGLGILTPTTLALGPNNVLAIPQLEESEPLALTFSSADDAGYFVVAPDGGGGDDISFVANTPPSLSGTTPSLNTNDETATEPFATLSVTDPDAGATEAVTITLSNAAAGTLSGTGLIAAGNGVYLLAAASPSAITSELDALIFTPTAHQVAPGASVTTGLTLSISNDGGPAVTSTSSITVTAVNDAATLSGASPSLSTTDETAIKPFAALSVSDPDYNATEAVTITLSNAANGTLSGTGLTASGNGVYMLTAASPSLITAELDALIFTPTAHQVAPGASVTTGLTLSISNDGGTPVTKTTSITATAVNDAPTITGAAAGQITAAGTAIKPFASVDITDPDLAVMDSLTITLKNSSGVATDADGTLSASGLTKTGTGTYILAAATPATLSAEVEALVFTPANSTSTLTTSFTLTASQTAGGSTVSTTNSTTSVTATGISYIYGPTSGNGTIEGTTGNDVITAYQYDNNIYDNGGNDTVHAGQGNANVYAGSGNVTIYLGGYYNNVSGGNGNDSVSGALGNTAISLGNGNDAISVGGYYDTVTLGNGNDSIAGPQGDATVTIGTGSDNVSLGGYDNSVHAGSTTGTDVINAGLGDAVIIGGNGNFTITAGGYGDNVTLGNGTDVVTGMQGLANITTGAGNDTIVLSGYGSTVNAGGGMNFITGGQGNDTFFLPTANTGLDTITNFSLTNGDSLNLTQALTTSGWNFQSSTLGDYLKVTEVGSNAMIGIAVGGNVTNIAELIGVSSLTTAKLLPHIIY
jgi:hypothetical protein